MLGKSFPSGGAPRGQGWVAIAGSLPLLLESRKAHVPLRGSHLRPASFPLWAFPVAPRTLYVPYFPLTFKRMTATKMSKPRTRIPRMTQRMRNTSSRDFQSSVSTVTEDSGSKNPKSGRKRDGHRLLLALLASPASLQLSHFPFGPIFLPSYFF